MAGYGAKEAMQESRRGRVPRRRVNLCGSCGCEIDESELLCRECRSTLLPPTNLRYPNQDALDRDIEHESEIGMWHCH